MRSESANSKPMLSSSSTAHDCVSADPVRSIVIAHFALKRNETLAVRRTCGSRSRPYIHQLDTGSVCASQSEGDIPKRRVKTRVRAVALAYPTAAAISFKELPFRNIV